MKRFDMHVHTEISKCSNMKIQKIISLAKKKGLNGLAITDHNEIRGGLALKKLNNDDNFEVIVGEEISTNKGHLLAYYIQERIIPGDFFVALDKIREQGGIAIHAHPLSFFRQHCSEKFLRENIKRLDGVEIFNGRELLSSTNNKVKKIANGLKVSGIGGSDAHFSFELGRVVSSFEGDFRKALKQKKIEVNGNLRMSLFGHGRTFLKKRCKI